MPNFGDAGMSLAKEASWEPEEPVETEEEGGVFLITPAVLLRPSP